MVSRVEASILGDSRPYGARPPIPFGMVLPDAEDPYIEPHLAQRRPPGPETRRLDRLGLACLQQDRYDRNMGDLAGHSAGGHRRGARAPLYPAVSRRAPP